VQKLSDIALQLNVASEKRVFNLRKQGDLPHRIKIADNSFNTSTKKHFQPHMSTHITINLKKTPKKPADFQNIDKSLCKSYLI